MIKKKMSEIGLATKDWFIEAFNALWDSKSVVSLNDINDPRHWTVGILSATGWLDPNTTNFVSTKNNVWIPVIGGTLSYTSALPVGPNPHVIICEYSDKLSSTLLNRTYQFLPGQTITLNENTAYLRISVGGGNLIPADEYRAATYGFRFMITK